MELGAVTQPAVCSLPYSSSTHSLWRISAFPIDHLSRSFHCNKLSSRCLRRTAVSFASLGFTADPRISVERAANNLLKDAASLLLYQEVLRVPPAQAFLKLLIALRRGDEAWKLLDAYGEFYRLMAAGNILSLEELILEGILVGEGNPFAEASANVGNPRSPWSKEVPPSLQYAAAADLYSLQRLSVTESTLVGWVVDLVSDVRPEWKVAAESTLSSRDLKKVHGSSGDVSCTDGVMLHSETRADDHGDFLAHTLQCRGGKLLRDTNFYAYKETCNLTILKEHSQKLFKHFERHISHCEASHVLVLGPAGSGKTTLVKSVLHSFVKQGKLRVIQMQKGEIKHLQSILEDLARNWQLRYVVVVDGLSITDDLPLVEWPENVMLCRISLSKELSMEKLSSETEDSFGMILTLNNLDHETYLLSVKEMLDFNKRLDVKPTDDSWQSHMDEADEWAKDRDPISVRSASQFVRNIL
ncbi:hypothetical protein KP509_38G005600 [Ceratopteris richardii]|uniref:Uncharacterized protein n=1 Tax=Ceratopteris richardii TaxID=49495 RepID=A0A8T2Q295_CERRI|nr:hypothetical protein KP509_38G005600 [Ceratopteris richardii]